MRRPRYPWWQYAVLYLVLAATLAAFVWAANVEKAL